MDNNKICVSLGTSNIYSLKNMMNESLNINVDFIEIRFDFFNKLTVFYSEFLMLNGVIF